jgi:hypothetical protein
VSFSPDGKKLAPSNADIESVLWNVDRSPVKLMVILEYPSSNE